MVNPLWATIQHNQPVIYRFLIIINQTPSRIRLRQKRIRATPRPGMKQSWRCPCGRNVEYRLGQRQHRVPSDTLVFDLQFRLRCSHCNRRAGFRITIFDNRTRGDSSKSRLERVVVAGSEGEG